MIIFSLEFPAETGREVRAEQKLAKIKIAILSLASGLRNVGLLLALLCSYQCQIIMSVSTQVHHHHITPNNTAKYQTSKSCAW